MRITLFANERAGRGVAKSELESIIERAGHTLVPTLTAATELLVAAGGDGTVVDAARLGLGTGLPLAIIPLGTANNIARSLDIEGTPADLAERWHQAPGTAIDVGLVNGSHGEQVFLESVGGGLVAAVIDSMTAEPDPPDEDVAHKMVRANRRYRELVTDIQPRHWIVTADDQRIEGHFLLVEVLNTDFLGPNLRLSRSVTPTDGLLSVVTIGEEQREELSAFLHAHHAGATTAFSLPAVHARTVKLIAGDDVHVDHTVYPWNALGLIEIQAQPGALTVLL